MLRALLVPVLFAWIAAPLIAHGGQYRGPGGAPPPTAGGPGGPTGAGNPTTGGRASSGDETSWQVWWEFNKEPFLAAELTHERLLPVSGSDEFFLGQSRRPRARDRVLPGDMDRRGRIVPALAAALQKERSRDLASACLVGLAKVGVDAVGVELDAVFTARLGSDNQEIRETAALAFGIAGRAQSFDVLSDLLRDTPRGRRLLDKIEVNFRTRAFAAYSLGMLARRAADPALRQRVHDLLLPMLDGDHNDDRDLRVAVVTALGMLQPATAATAADKRLAWITVEELWRYFARDLGKGDQVIQAHVPTAVARLLGRGRSSAHQAAKRLLVAELAARERRHNTILQSAALALGQLALPGEDEAEDQEVAQQLVRTYGDAVDQQTRFFAALALGRIGGESCRQTLLRLYAGANVGIERPWVALALGLIADRSARAGSVDKSISRLLLEDLRNTQNDVACAAFAVSLGLTRDRDAAVHVMALLREREREQVLAGYLCTSLALLGDTRAVVDLREVIARSVRRPFVLQQAAIALGRLGDREVVPQLVAMLGEHTSTAALSAIANALALMGDRRCIDPLLSMLKSEEHTQLALAFAAAALGGVGDKDEMPWNTPLSRDVNYRARVPTLTDGKAGVLDIL